MGDLIDRYAALNELENIDCSDGVGLSALKCDVVEDAISAIKALPPAQPGWIPTSVRLPEDNEEVLFCDNEGERWLGWHYGFWKTERLDFNEDEVVAWMPLPTPYHEGDDKHEG